MAPNAETPALVIPQLIVGLGNPGEKYERTRHNIGFEAIAALSHAWHIPLAEHRKFQGRFGEGRFQGKRVFLLEPLTFMNLSGQSIRAITDWYKISPDSVLVIYDDMDLPVGKLRLRLSGSAGGHNGMKSTIAHLGTQNFPRLRIGIGNPKTATPDQDKDAVSHVLGRFSQPETALMTDVLKLVVEAVEVSCKQGFEKAMNLYNSRAVVSNSSR